MIKKIFFIFMILFFIAEAKPVRLVLKNLEIITNCDQVISDPYQKKCIDFKARKPRLNFYYLTKKIINGSIKKRLNFKDDSRMLVQNYIKCYSYTNKDKGHLAPDASFDYDYCLLKTTYLSSNIVPEVPYCNRELIAQVEKKFRYLINKYGDAYIITGAHYRYSKKYRFNLNNKYHLNCGYYPDYIYKIIFIPKIYKIEMYIITNKKPYKLYKVSYFRLIRILQQNHILIRLLKWN